MTEPHIVAIYDAGEINGRLFLVMPVIDGIDLGCWLQRHHHMPPPLAVRVIEQLASALDTAHAAGLVHRDVKPSNALMTTHEHVYLIDFGIAHDAAATKLTATGSLLGSLPYMVPERLLTSKSDARSDVYSLACTFYECLTGERPYADDVVIAGHLSTEPPRPSALVEIATGFDDVIACGMAKDPDQRYQTAGQLAVAARQALDAASARTVPQPAPPLVELSKTEHARPSPVGPDLHRAETLAAPPVTGGQPTEPARPRQKLPITIGVGLLSAAVIFAVLTALASRSHHEPCVALSANIPCGETWVGPIPEGWTTFLQPYAQTALVASLLTAGILVLRRYPWWTYVLAPIAGACAWSIYDSHREEWDQSNYFAFVVCVLVPTTVCVLLAWVITRRMKRSHATGASSQ